MRVAIGIEVGRFMWEGPKVAIAIEVGGVMRVGRRAEGGDRDKGGKSDTQNGSCGSSGN